jgi:uncharacterized protein with NRDE domain
MCTILIANRVNPGYPVLFAANRDEYYSRASTGPELLARSPKIVGGRDKEKGGTWMGATAKGFFVGLTNQRTFNPSDKSLRSRGEVVLETLRAGEVPAAERYLRGLRPAEYNPFNLVFGDAAALRVAYVRPAGVEIAPLGPGLYVLANDRLQSEHFPKIRRAEALGEKLLTRPWEELRAALPSLLGDHAEPPPSEIPAPPADSLLEKPLLQKLQALCIHTPLYGTRSSTVVALAPGKVARYLYSPGPPCKTPLEDMTGLFD